ncbi:hypothetical protein [Parashewanella tropica]|uniref:hypothetical protein n=1 Tax=Parashewanella tropica TaxID=2547970 RepID=UPI0010592F75|nr:hypothetical protein [Parashewanella tropica]
MTTKVGVTLTSDDNPSSSKQDESSSDSLAEQKINQINSPIGKSHRSLNPKDITRFMSVAQTCQSLFDLRLFAEHLQLPSVSIKTIFKRSNGEQETLKNIWLTYYDSMCSPYDTQTVLKALQQAAFDETSFAVIQKEFWSVFS